jgi:hypothetical protein
VEFALDMTLITGFPPGSCYILSDYVSKLFTVCVITCISPHVQNVILFQDAWLTYLKMQRDCNSVTVKARKCRTSLPPTTVKTKAL